MRVEHFIHLPFSISSFNYIYHTVLHTADIHAMLPPRFLCVQACRSALRRRLRLILHLLAPQTARLTWVGKSAVSGLYFSFRDIICTSGYLFINMVKVAFIVICGVALALSLGGLRLKQTQLSRSCPSPVRVR